MYIKKLFLKGVGPFVNEDLVFIDNNSVTDKPPTIIITGENGAGKSVILDAIRTILLGIYSSRLERNIIADKNNFEIKAVIELDGQTNLFESKEFTNQGSLKMNDASLGIHIYSEFRLKTPFLVDYWTSKVSTDSYKISSISKFDTSNYLKDSLFGNHVNVDVTKFICFIDYLKDSVDDYEYNVGSYLFEKVVDIVNSSLNDGEFSHVARTSLDPIIEIRGMRLTLEKLSSGNQYLIQRLLSLLQKAYSAHVEWGCDVEAICQIKGLLLIDEAENHLHPKWQKIFLKTIKKFFPNIQIISTTHSPFIISSIENSKVFVCKSQHDKSIIEDQTTYYVNKPVEEILRTPLFDTDSFNSTISRMLMERKEAIRANDREKIDFLESELMKINPDYFSYLNLDNILDDFTKGQ